MTDIQPKPLLAWELGAGYGHVGEMAPLANQLIKKGFRVTAALQQPEAWEKLHGSPGVALLQAPDFREKRKAGVALPSWAAILETAGFRDAETLIMAVIAWGDIFRKYEITHVIGNYAPTALLAAYIYQLPHFTVGTGFHAPPPLEPLPPIVSIEQSTLAGRAAIEQRVLSNCNAAIATLAKGRPSLKSLAVMLAYSHAMLCTYVELDHYHGLRDGKDGPTAQYFGSQFQSPKQPSALWPRKASDQPRLLAYLNRRTIQHNNMVRTLGELGWPTVMHISGLPENLPPKWVPDNIKLYRQPINLPATLPSCRLMICPGGHGTLSQALLAGKPLLMVPTQAEQMMVAERVAAMGAGLVAPVRSNANIPELLRELVANPEYAEAAQAFARRYRGMKLNALSEVLIAEMTG